MTIPLFNRSQGEIAAAQAAIAELRARRDAARRTVESPSIRRIARIAAQRERVESFRTRVIPAAAELADLAEESYKAGRTPAADADRGAARTARRQARLSRRAARSSRRPSRIWRRSSVDRLHNGGTGVKGPWWSWNLLLLVVILALPACGEEGRRGRRSRRRPDDCRGRWQGHAAGPCRAARRTRDDRRLPNEDVRISALVPGRVMMLKVAEGDAVTAGQVVAEIDSAAARRPEAAGRSSRGAGEGRAREREAEPRADRPAVHAGHRGRQGGGGRARAAGSRRGRRRTAHGGRSTRPTVSCRSTKVTSPIAGSVVKRLVSVGEQVDGTAAQPLIEVANLDVLELAANVRPSTWPRSTRGRPWTSRRMRTATSTFPGHVIAIAPAVDAATNTALTRIAVANTRTSAEDRHVRRRRASPSASARAR